MECKFEPYKSEEILQELLIKPDDIKSSYYDKNKKLRVKLKPGIIPPKNTMKDKKFVFFKVCDSYPCLRKHLVKDGNNEFGCFCKFCGKAYKSSDPYSLFSHIITDAHLDNIKGLI